MREGKRGGKFVCTMLWGRGMAVGECDESRRGCVVRERGDVRGGGRQARESWEAKALRDWRVEDERFIGVWGMWARDA